MSSVIVVITGPERTGLSVLASAEVAVVEVRCLAELAPRMLEGDVRFLVDPVAGCWHCQSLLSKLGREPEGPLAAFGSPSVPGLSLAVGPIPVQGEFTPPPPGRWSAGRAWRQRGSVLSPSGKGVLGARILEQIRSHEREAYTVSQLARDLHTGERQLVRLCRQLFRYPPGTLIGVARAQRVAAALVDTVQSLKGVAESNGYPGRRKMARHFERFAGVSPAAYRRLSVRVSMSENDTKMSENGPFPGATFRGK